MFYLRLHPFQLTSIFLVIFYVYYGFRKNHIARIQQDIQPQIYSNVYDHKCFVGIYHVGNENPLEAHPTKVLYCELKLSLGLKLSTFVTQICMSITCMLFMIIQSNLKYMELSILNPLPSFIHRLAFRYLIFLFVIVLNLNGTWAVK